MMFIRRLIQMARDSEFPTSLLPYNTGQNVQKNINITSASETINAAVQTEALDNTISTESDQQLDDLPVISDSDIEEVIKSIQDNQDIVTDKVMDFNVDSLLNDPYTL